MPTGVKRNAGLGLIVQAQLGKEWMGWRGPGSESSLDYHRWCRSGSRQVSQVCEHNA